MTDQPDESPKIPVTKAGEPTTAYVKQLQKDLGLKDRTVARNVAKAQLMMDTPRTNSWLRYVASLRASEEPT